MRTIEDIVKDLRARAAAGEDVRQQVISHQALATLRAELAGLDPAAEPDRATGVAQQIRLHLSMVDEDSRPADQPVKVKAERSAAS